MKEDCIFCKIAKKEIPSEFIYESENFFAILDVHPKTKGHTLIIPKRHFTNLIDMPAILGNELLDVVKKVAEKRFKEGAHGFNLVVNNGKSAGQIVNHVHVHLIPRKERDSVSIAGI